MDHLISLCCIRANDVQDSSLDWWIKFLPAIVTILLFLLGYYVNQKREKAKTLDSLEEQEEYFYVVAESIIKYSRSLNEKVKSFINQLADPNFKHFIMQGEANLVLEDYEVISFATLLKIFVTGKQGKVKHLIEELKKNYHSFRMIKVSRNSFEEMFKSFAQSYEDHSSKWQISLSKFMGLLNTFVNMAATSEFGNDNSLVELEKILKAWIDTQNTDINHTREFLLNPLRDYWRKTPGDSRSPQILSVVDECDFHADMILSEISFYKKEFERILQLFEDSIKTFDETTTYFKGLQNRGKHWIVWLFLSKKGRAADRLKE